jgi:hypothetical protein
VLITIWSQSAGGGVRGTWFQRDERQRHGDLPGLPAASDSALAPPRHSSVDHIQTVTPVPTRGRTTTAGSATFPAHGWYVHAHILLLSAVVDRQLNEDLRTNMYFSSRRQTLSVAQVAPFAEGEAS